MTIFVVNNHYTINVVKLHNYCVIVKTNFIMKKKSVDKEVKRGSNYSISSATKYYLEQLAIIEKRSMSNVIEVLVEAEAKKKGIALPTS